MGSLEGEAVVALPLPLSLLLRVGLDGDEDEDAGVLSLVEEDDVVAVPFADWYCCWCWSSCFLYQDGIDILGFSPI